MCILLAEDEFLIRNAAREFLEDAGHEVVTVEHGREAIAQIDQHPGRFVCVVTDYHMPHVQGDRVIEHFRGVYPLAPVILASAFPHATTPQWRQKHRVSLLLKPYPMGELVALVGRVLT